MNKFVLGIFLLAVCCSEESGTKPTETDREAGSGFSAGGGGETCECEDGRYSAIYTEVEGSCETVDFYLIPIEYQYSHTEQWSLQEISFDNTLTTEIIYQGCVLGIRQEVERNDALISSIQGEVEIESRTRLSGRVFRTEFNQDLTLRCDGIYDVTLTKTADLPVAQ